MHLAQCHHVKWIYIPLSFLGETEVTRKDNLMGRISHYHS